MNKLITYAASGMFCLAVSAPAAAGNANQPVIPCDQPGATPGGTTALDHTTAPCDTGVINDVGNTSVTGAETPGPDRLPPTPETRQLPPPHNPNPQQQTNDR